MDEISLEKYRTRFPPKEHEEAVRMLLDGIGADNGERSQLRSTSRIGASGKHSAAERDKMTIRRHNTQENLSTKPTNDLRTDGSRFNATKHRVPLRTIHGSTKSSSANTVDDSDESERQMDPKLLRPINGLKSSSSISNSNNNTLPLMRSKGTSTTSESVSHGSNSNGCNGDEENNEVGFGDPIPSRTIAVQCDLKLSSVKRGSNSAGEPVFDPSMQASSISATRYGFYRFSAEELENRRQLKRSISSRNIAHSRYHLNEIGSNGDENGSIEEPIVRDEDEIDKAKLSSSELSLSSSLSHSDDGEFRRRLKGNDVLWRRNEELDQRRPETALSFVSANKLRNGCESNPPQDRAHLSSTESEPSLIENPNSTSSRGSRGREPSLPIQTGSLPRKPTRAASYQVLNTTSGPLGGRLSSKRQVKAAGLHEKIDIMSETEIFESSCSDAENTTAIGKTQRLEAIESANRRQRLPSNETTTNKRSIARNTLERKYPNMVPKAPARQEDYETNNNNVSKEANMIQLERAMSVNRARDFEPLTKPLIQASNMSRPTTGEDITYDSRRPLNNKPQTNRVYSETTIKPIDVCNGCDNNETDNDESVASSPQDHRRQLESQADNIQWKHKLSRLPSNGRDSSYKLSSLSRRPSQQRSFLHDTQANILESSAYGNRFEPTRYSSTSQLSDSNNYDANGQVRRGTLTKRRSDSSSTRTLRTSPIVGRYATEASSRFEQPVYTTPSSTASTIKYSATDSSDTLKRSQIRRAEEYNSLRRNNKSNLDNHDHNHIYADPPKQPILRDYASATATNDTDHAYGQRFNSINTRKSSRSYSMRDQALNGNYKNDESTKQGCSCRLNDDANQSSELFEYGPDENEINGNQFREPGPLRRQMNDSSSEASFDEAHRRFAEVAQEHQLDYDSQHKLNESGLPNALDTNESSSPRIAHNIRSKGASSYLGLQTDNYNNEPINRSKVKRSGTMIGLRPVQITGRAMSQQSLTRPTMPITSGRRMRYGTGSHSGGSDVGGSSMSLVSRLQGRYENAHTRTPVVMYIPQAVPKSTRSSSDGIDSRAFGSSLSRKGSKISRKSRSQDRTSRKGNSSRNGSDSETSSMLKTLIKPRNSRLQSSHYNSKRTTRLTNHRNDSDEEDMDGVGQLASEMDSYKFRRRYSVPKDAKINWFAKLKQRVTRS